MDQLHPDAALIQLLLRTVAGGVNVHLFTSPTTPPGLSATLASFTEESAPGYPSGGINVTAGSFSTPTVAGHVGSIQAPDVAFSPSSGTWTDFGYYITDASNTVLLAFGFFDSAPILTTFPLSITIPVKFGNQSKYVS